METCQKNSGNGETVMAGRIVVDRQRSHSAAQIVFEKQIEELLSHCPNMTGEDDRRDLCSHRCHAYYWCVSLEPAEVADDD